MRKISLSAVLFFILLITNAYSQDYLSGLVSSLHKGHSAEATMSLGAYKSTLIGCLMMHSGAESTCKDSVNFQSSGSFDYSFSIPPKDGSQAWAMKASGKGNYTSDDAVILTSDEHGTVVCSSTGKMAGSC
jgi:hypothetical protein